MDPRPSQPKLLPLDPSSSSPPLVLIPLLRDDNTVIELCELLDLYDLHPRLVQQPTPMLLPPLLCIEHRLHRQRQRGCVLDTWCACVRLLVWQSLVIDVDPAVGVIQKSGEVHLEDLDARIIVEVVQDLAEVVCSRVWAYY
jgi:hypothetical protein